MMSLCDSMGLMVVKKTRMVWVLLALFLKASVASRTMVAPGVRMWPWYYVKP